MLGLGQEGRAVLLQQDALAGELSTNPQELTVLTVIVTGSSHWWDRPSVYRPLDRLRRKCDRLVVRNGKAKRGLDAIVSDWTELHKGDGVVEDPFPADWTPRPGVVNMQAGLIRNQRMVDEGADLVVVWAKPCRKSSPWCPPGEHPSHGTADCVRRARDSGIPVYFCPTGLRW